MPPAPCPAPEIPAAFAGTAMLRVPAPESAPRPRKHITERARVAPPSYCFCQQRREKTVGAMQVRRKAQIFPGIEFDALLRQRGVGRPQLELRVRRQKGLHHLCVLLIEHCLLYTSPSPRD